MDKRRGYETYCIAFIISFMSKIRFSIIGTGWRSLFYVRIAKALPDIFTLLAIKVRNKEKEEYFLKQDVRCVYDDEDIISDKPDFVVVCVDKPSLFDVTLSYLERGVNVFCETPLSIERSSLLFIHERINALPAKLVIAEQYPFMPLYRVVKQIISSGLIGDIQSVYLSLCHDYHAIALARAFLDEREGGKLLFLDKTEEEFLETGGRNGAIESETIRPVSRKRFAYRFKDGKTLSYDFSSEQYHTRIGQNHFIIHGSRGEICDSKVMLRDFMGEIINVTDENGFFISNHLELTDKSGNNAHTKILQGFVNPHPKAPLSDDEIAICILLENFKEAISSASDPVYPLKEALLDAIIASDIY